MALERKKIYIRRSPFANKGDSLNFEANDKLRKDEMESFTSNDTENLQEQANLSENQMESRYGNESSDVNELQDFTGITSNGNVTAPISQTLHLSEGGGMGYIPEPVVPNEIVWRHNIVSAHAVGNGSQETTFPGTTHVKVLGKDGKENQEGAEESLLDVCDREADESIPAWAQAKPLDGYIKHPVAGYVMHPSFYNNFHLQDCNLIAKHLHDGEVDDPLCSPRKQCIHVRDCFEIRVRMAVLSYLQNNISYRDAEYIWGVSRSTIQRRKAMLEEVSPLIFLLIPFRATS